MEPMFRTDLAVEVRESFLGDGGEIPGVVLEERESVLGVKVTEVIIKNEEGAQAMRKPKGRYITIEAPALMKGDEEMVQNVAEILAGELGEILKTLTWKKQKRSILVAGLGNRFMTADALGPLTMEHLLITRHMGLEETEYEISSITPGVMGQTGMETAEILKGIVHETEPGCVVVVDALAARSTARLGTTIQLTDTGIGPGSGIGNHRSRLDSGCLGVPVVAIGVPTVVSAATIVYDATEMLIEMLRQGLQESGVAEIVETMTHEERYGLFHELWSGQNELMFVMPKNMDEMVKRWSVVISEGLNLAFLA